MRGKSIYTHTLFFVLAEKDTSKIIFCGICMHECVCACACVWWMCSHLHRPEGGSKSLQCGVPRSCQSLIMGTDIQTLVLCKSTKGFTPLSFLYCTQGHIWHWGDEVTLGVSSLSTSFPPFNCYTEFLENAISSIWRYFWVTVIFTTLTWTSQWFYFQAHNPLGILWP